MVIKTLLLSALMSLAVGAVPLAAENGSPTIAATEYVWEEVTKVSSLAAGDVIAITNGSYYMCDSNADVASGSYSDDSNYLKSYKLVDGYANIPFSGGSFTLETYGTNANEYRIVSNLDSTRALGLSSNGANTIELKTSHKTDSNGWLFSSTSSNKMGIKHTGFSRYICKSTTSGDTGFRAYSSVAYTIKVFKKVAAPERHVTSISASGYESIVAYPNESIDFSSVKVTGTYDIGGTVDVTSYCTFSPTVAQSTIGTQTITVTCSKDTPDPTTFDITVVQKPVDLTYEKVTAASELDVGSSIAIAVQASSKVASSFNTKYLTSITGTFVDDTLKFKDTDGVNVFTLEQGYTTGTYALKSSLDNKYIAYANSGADIAQATTITQTSSWIISVDSGVAHIKSCSAEMYIKYNSSASSTFRLYSSASAVTDIDIFRYNGGGEHVVLSEDSHTVSEQDSFTLTAEAKLFKATSWSFTSDNANVELTPNGASCVVKGLTPGSSIVTATANGLYSASCVVTIQSVTYDILNGDSYCFLSNDNKYFMSQSLGAVEDLDLTDVNNLFTFVRAYKGNNTYYIKTSTNNYVEYSGEGSKLGLSLTASSYWTVAKNADSTYTWTIDGRILSFYTKSSTEHYWYVFDTATEAQSHNRMVGALSFVTMGYNGSPTKVDYDLGDEFNPTGITSYFARYETEEHEIVDVPFTGAITWAPLETGSTAKGSATVSGKSRTITITGLNISSYSPKELVLDSSGTIVSYYPGQSVNISGLGVKVKYEDSSSNVKYRDLTTEDVTYSPSRVSPETTKVTVTVKGKSLSASYDITVTEPLVRTTNRLVIGDHIVIAQMTYNPSGILGGRELTMNDSSVAVASDYEYVPACTSTYEVLAGSSSGTFAFKNIVSGKYLQKNGTALQEQSTELSTDASFNYLYDRNDRISYLYQTIDSTDYYVYYNADANKFRIDDNYTSYMNQLDIYSYATTSTVQSISVDSSTTTTEFEVGDDFVWTSLVVTANYGNGVSNTLPVGSFSITQPDMSTAGSKVITVNYFGKTASYIITVSNKEEVITLTGLRLDNVKDTYYVGDTPEYTAMALYSNSTEVDVTALTTYEFYSQSASVGQRTCTVTYKEKGQTTQQAQFKYVVVETPAVETVTVKEEVVLDCVKGNTYQIVITSMDGVAVPETGADQASAIHRFTFTSLVESVATVTSEGLVTFHNLGTSYIKVEARSGSASKTIRFFVPGKTTSIDLPESEITLEVGQSYLIKPVINPVEARTELIRYETSNKDVASVTSDGQVSALAAGQCTIYVMSEDGSIVKDLQVTVISAPIPPTPTSESTSTVPPAPTSETTVVPSTSEVPTSTSGGSTSEGPGPTPVDPNKNVGLTVALVIIGTVAVAGGIIAIILLTGNKKKKGK